MFCASKILYFIHCSLFGFMLSWVSCCLFNCWLLDRYRLRRGLGLFSLDRGTCGLGLRKWSCVHHYRLPVDLKLRFLIVTAGRRWWPTNLTTAGETRVSSVSVLAPEFGVSFFDWNGDHKLLTVDFDISSLLAYLMHAKYRKLSNMKRKNEVSGRSLQFYTGKAQLSPYKNCWLLKSAQVQKLRLKVTVKRHSSPEQIISELRGVTCHIWSHSVTCHPIQVNETRLTPVRQAGRGVVTSLQYVK